MAKNHPGGRLSTDGHHTSIVTMKQLRRGKAASARLKKWEEKKLRKRKPPPTFNGCPNCGALYTCKKHRTAG